MSDRLVVHCKREPFDVYVGRPARPTPRHYGNPFSNRPGTLAAEVTTDPITDFYMWLVGDSHRDLEPERRRWILDTLPQLAGKVLGCWCVTPERPEAPCHGWVLVNLSAHAAAGGIVDRKEARAARQAAATAARATDRTNIQPVTWLETNGRRQHICCTLGADLAESRRLAEQLDRLRRATVDSMTPGN